MFEQGPTGPCRLWRDVCVEDLPYWLPEPGTPVLVLSDLGCLTDQVETRQAWWHLGRRLRVAGLKPVALMPCPQRLWTHELIQYFYPVCWDRGYRFARQWQVPRCLPAGDENPNRYHGTDELLTLLSPAIRVEPALLRAARYLLPRDMADVGSEAALWQHPDVMTDSTALAYVPQVISQYRQAFQQKLLSAEAGTNHPWVQVVELLKQYHAHLSPAINDEEQRNCFDLLGELAIAYDPTFIESMVKTLFANPQDVGLRSWVRRVATRQLEASWQQYEPLAAAWAKVNKACLQSDKSTSLPPGFDIKKVAWVLGEPASSYVYVLRQVGQTLILSPADDALSHVSASHFVTGSPIVELTLGGRQLQWQQQIENDVDSETLNHCITVHDDSVITLPVPKNVTFSLFSDRDEFTIASLTKPYWATAIGRDGLGLFVEFVEGEGRRRAYWMNPGLYPVKDLAGREIGLLSIETGYFQDEQQFRVFDQQGFVQPDWADEIGLDEYGLYVSSSIEGVSQVMRWIMPGQFMMGSPESEAGHNDDELLHEVILTQGYWLADTACTQALWQAVMGENPSGFKKDLNPMERVSWNDAQEFIKRLSNEQSGLDLRLPSEAEWEYACRAGTTMPFWFGENIAPEQVNYDGNHPYAGAKKGLYREQTVEVKSLPCDSWGLYQMHGNVWEWCADWYGEYANRTLIDPQGPDQATRRVLRGGSWIDVAGYSRSAKRDRYVPDDRNDYIGLRLARG